MKTLKFLMPLAFVTLFLSSCQKEELKTILVDFEDVALTSGISTGSGFTNGNCNFSGDPTQFWNGGVICSSKSDTLTAGYLNQFSCIAGSGALNSANFGVLYSPGSFTCPANEEGNFSIESIMVNNSTYAYIDMKNGNSPFSKKFVSGDWFKLTMKGFLSKTETASVDVYLADFRNSKSFLMKNWQKVDLKSMGKVDSIAFSFSSSDNGDFGMNTPAYVCIDNIEFTQIISVK